MSTDRVRHCLSAVCLASHMLNKCRRVVSPRAMDPRLPKSSADCYRNGHERYTRMPFLHRWALLHPGASVQNAVTTRTRACIRLTARFMKTRRTPGRKRNEMPVPSGGRPGSPSPEHVRGVQSLARCCRCNKTVLEKYTRGQSFEFPSESALSVLFKRMTLKLAWQRTRMRL